MKTLQRTLLCLITGLCFFSMVHAQQLSQQPVQQHFTPVQNSQAAQAQVKGEEWGLMPEEWQRYEELMDGPRGLYSPGIDPLTALGIEARSDEERRYYAQKQVQAEAARVEKELAYQHAYDAAWKRLYPALQPVTDLTDNSTTITGDGRLAVFVKENCLPCEQQVKHLQARGQSFDIYLIDSRGDDTTVRRWAAGVGIDAARVRLGTITLNHDAGRWQLLDVGGELPAVVRNVQGMWVRQ